MGRSRKARGNAPGPPAPPASAAPQPPGAAAPAPVRGSRTGARTFALAAPASLALILGAALILQFPALGMPFFADDYLFLDQTVRGSLIAALAAPDPIGNFYRPVGRQLYFWLVARAGAGSAFVSHGANLALWLAVLALLFAVARRLAGPRAGLIAAGLLALHYAADVPVGWASGSQELIAVVGALGALWLHLSGRRIGAGLLLLVALLAKEVVVFTPLVAVIAARGRGEPWRSAARRAWPLAAAVAAWVVIVWSATHTRVAAPERLGVTPVTAAAAFAHLLQVVCGIEWYARVESTISQPATWVAALALVLLAVAAGVRRRPEPVPGAREAGVGGGVAVGIVWALVGAAPVAAVADIWSAYYYLFALCGAALALGTWLAARHRGWALGAVAVLAWNSAHASALPRHALVREPWTTCSHVNRSYLDRGTRAVHHYLGQLRAARPSLPPRSTLFFSGLPGAVAFQTADGPLVRWVYRDTSLRSYYLNSFDLAKARRGPYFFFECRDDSLVETTGHPDQFYRIALGAIMSDRPATAREMLWAEQDRDSTARAAYWLAWVNWDLGERDRALELLRAAGFPPAVGPAPELAAALAALAARDSVGAWRIARRATADHVLDAAAHGLLSDLGFMVMQADVEPVIDAYAARLLAPESAEMWRRWAFVQIQNSRALEGAASLRRYFDLAGAEGARDEVAQAAARYLSTKYPVARQVLEPRPAAP